MEQISGKSPVLRESVMELYIEQKVDHENRPHFFPNIIGKTMGRLGVGVNAINVYNNPTPDNIFNLARSVGSYISLPYCALDIYATCDYYNIQNAIIYRHGFAGTYAGAVSGAYAIPW